MLKPIATKDRILAAARDNFDREGLAGVSMRRIAEAVGLTPMAIYRHYAGKDALIDALMLDGFTAWEARVGAIAAADPMRWLVALMKALLDFALAEPRRYEAAFLLPARKARRYPDDFEAGRSPAVVLAAARIEQAQRQGLLADALATEIMMTLSALSQGFISMYRAGRFISETEFRVAYDRAVHRCFLSFGGAP